MNDKHISSEATGSSRRRFVRGLLDDLHALERMLETGMIETDVRRIGAEQELFLVDSSWRPACLAMQILSESKNPRFTTELGQFNLEVNLDPLTLGGDCLGQLERDLCASIDELRELASRHDAHILLTGILPTLRKSDLGLENMTPKPRYFALNDAMCSLRQGAYELYIKGLDELLLKHDSVMLEACNASFQVHFQVGAAEFANVYNVAQAVAGPVLAAAVNSPMLFGRQLWQETRIALFQQSVDTRSSTNFLRERSPRVTFGRDWVRHSVLELYREDVSRFRSLVTTDLDESSMATLARGEVPELRALRMHNGTVYRWNRACYGLTDGVPHLRIENRVLPAGPSVVDEVANAALWLGLISGLASRYDDITQLMHFEDVKINFRSAARLGLAAQYVWFDGETVPAVNLICDRLLPIAREGLERQGIDADDIDRYLGVIDERVRDGRTGANWITHSLAGMRGQGNISERLNALTAAIVERQKDNTPVARWEPASISESGGWERTFLRVEQYMTTDLFTVAEDESLDLVASMMEWKSIRHVPVEDRDHRLVGLISYRTLLRLLARGLSGEEQKNIEVSEIMKRKLITVTPGASTLEAIEMMRQHKISCLPVVKDDRLVGIITERDLMSVAAVLLERQLKE